MSKRVENELHRELLAANALNPWTGYNSSPRGSMFASHLGQSLNILGATPRRCLSGVEREFGKYTFSIKMPCDAQIIRRLDRYPRNLSGDSIKENPETLIIYEDVNTKEVGCLSLTRFKSLDRQFGFRYKYKPVESKLVPGQYVPKGTVIADSPAVTDSGDYMYGIEAETAFMSVPQVIEDGAVVRKGFLKELTTRGYESRVANWGNRRYPINLYGDENHYKPFPDIGDRIREDGLLFALREYDELLGPVDMTPKALMEPDFFYDRLIYAEPGARVVDVVVHHDINANYHPTPVGMEVQTEKYRKANSAFYKSIEEEYFRLKGRRKDSLRLTPEFQRLVVEAFSDSAMTRSSGRKEKVVRTFRRNEIDDWRVEVTFEYDIVPTIGFKFTGTHGNKGIICDVWEDEKMPVDSKGNRADFIMDGDSVVKRMNIGVMYEQYINACSREVTQKVRELIGGETKEELARAWEYLLGYYKIVSPPMYDVFVGGNYSYEPEHHLKEVAKNGVYLYLPSDNPVAYADVVRELRVKYPAHIGPVSYVGRSGKPSVTTSDVLIGSMYIILLEKTGEDWSGVSSAKLQHFGIPAKLTNADKYSAPGRAQPVRFLGESEVRLVSAMAGAPVTADLLDQSNSPGVHKEIVYNIAKAEQPTNVERIIDRHKLPVGQGRPMVFLRHMFECAGVRMVVPPLKTD